MLLDPTSFTFLIRKGVMAYCLTILGSDPEDRAYSLWEPHQRSILQISVLGLLSSLIPNAAKEFRQINGPIHLIQFLENLIQQGSVLNSKRVDLIRVHISLLRFCLLSLLILSEGGPVSKKLLGQLNIFDHLLPILADRNQTPLVWKEALIMCSSLCQGYKANKQIFGETGGVTIIIPFLKYKNYTLTILGFHHQTQPRETSFFWQQLNAFGERYAETLLLRTHLFKMKVILAH